MKTKRDHTNKAYERKFIRNRGLSNERLGFSRPLISILGNCNLTLGITHMGVHPGTASFACFFLFSIRFLEFSFFIGYIFFSIFFFFFWLSFFLFLFIVNI